MLDALRNPIVVGNFYGYSFNRNGHITTVVGKAKSTNDISKKVSLSNCRESSGIWGDSKDFIAQERGRSVYGCHVFPVTL